MPDVLYFNGRYTTTDERVLGVEDRGFQFGDAIYEVLKFIGKGAIFPREHFQRMQRCLADLEIPCPFDYAGFTAVVRGILERTEFDDGIIYLQITRGEIERTHYWPEGITPTVVAYSRRFIFPDDAKRERGISVITAPDVRWQYCHIKSVNLLANAMAKKQAQRAGVDEVLFMRDGFVTEGSSSTFFGVRDGGLVTTQLGEEILPGVLRGRTISLAIREGLPIEFGAIAEDELGSIAEAFITSTTQGVMPVRAIDGKLVRSGERGAVTTRLQRLLMRAEEQSADEWRSMR